MAQLESRKTRLVFTTASEVRSWGSYSEEVGVGDSKRTRRRSKVVHRRIIIEAHPTFATVKLSGIRSKHSVTWDAIYNLALRLEAQQVQREKREKKKAARKGGR